MSARAALIAALAATVPASAAAWRMTPAFGPGALLPLMVPPLVWAAARRTRGRGHWTAVLAAHLALVPGVVFLSLLPLPLPPALWGSAVWVGLPLLVHRFAGGRAAGVPHGLLWVIAAWSAWGTLVAGEGGAV